MSFCLGLHLSWLPFPSAQLIPLAIWSSSFCINSARKTNGMWPWMIETCLEPPSNITQVIKIWGEYYKDLRYKAIMWYMTKSFVLAQLEHSVTPMTRKIEINLRGKPCSNYCREHTLQTTESIPPRTASQTRNLTISVFWITNPSLQPPLPLPSLYLCKFK